MVTGRVKSESTIDEYWTEEDNVTFGILPSVTRRNIDDIEAVSLITDRIPHLGFS